VGELIKARTATTVPMADMRHIAIEAGQTVDLDEVRENFLDLWNNGDRWLHSIFVATNEVSGPASSGLVFEDPVQRAMAEHETLVRERAALPMEHRVGSPADPPNITDRFRTLPTSGADLAADHNVAAGVEFDAAGKQAEEEASAGVVASDRPMPGDQPAASAAPDAAAVPDETPSGDEPVEGEPVEGEPADDEGEKKKGLFGKKE